MLAVACALALWRAGAAHRGDERGGGAPTAALAEGAPAEADRAITPARRARWVLLAAVPSSLMLSVTTYLSTDIAAIPLLWIVPLAIYLLTFALVFGRRRLVPHRVWVELLPVALLPLVLVLVARANEPLLLVIPTHLVVFFVAAMVCHGELAQDRPDPRHLTAYYLWLSVGGVVGGAFTALLAPRVFTNVLEYPLVLALLPLLPARPPSAWQGRGRQVLDVVLPLALGVLTVTLIAGLERRAWARRPSAPPSAWPRSSASPSGGGRCGWRWGWRRCSSPDRSTAARRGSSCSRSGASSASRGSRAARTAATTC